MYSKLTDTVMFAETAESGFENTVLFFVIVLCFVILLRCC